MLKKSIYLSLTFFFIAFVSKFSSAQNDWQNNPAIEKKIDSLISLMTLKEKTELLHASSSFTSGGVKRLGIPELVMSDGPHGVRMEHGRDWEIDSTTSDSATYLPVGITLASTWNKNLGYQSGKVLGSEAADRGKDIILGPGVNIIRTPLNGRNFEYLSEDPYLAGEMAVGYIKGVESNGIGACVKHYAANNQETLRGKINVIVDERTLHEIYLPAFKHAVQDGSVLTIMTAYNKINGEYCSNNKYLFDVLHNEWGFKGTAISDWGAVHSTEPTLKHGVDIEMGTELANGTKDNPDYNGFYLAEPLIKFVKKHPRYEKYVDEKVRRILRVMFAVHKFDKKRPEGSRNTPEHHKTALKIAEEGIVLLKNDYGLPVGKKADMPENAVVKTIAVIGDNATRKHAGEGGSSQVKAEYEITPLEGIKQVFGDDYKIVYAPGYKPNKENKLDSVLMKKALNVAKHADLVIYIGGWLHNIEGEMWGKYRYDAEGHDKESYEFPFGQTELMNRLSDLKPMITVILGGSFAKTDKWLEKSGAVLFAGYPGMEGGKAIAEILAGKINPSGKLPFTIAKELKYYPAHSIGEYPGNGQNVIYRDSIWVGYRYFDKHPEKILFPFGYGLSYTTFSIDNLKLKKKVFPSGEPVKFSIDVTNTGKLEGKEVVQVYISDPVSRVVRPVKELKAFEKVNLKPGETKTVSFILDKNAFSYWDPESKKWKLEPGDFIINVGNSSQNIMQKAKITIK